MEQLTGFNGPNVISANCHERNGPSAAVNEFDFVPTSLLVDVHDSPDVTTA